ncbi:hypothetical protein Nepgr_026033 [Nepenthes gracilis]|uniref:Uncharacterized protein n=1 Tax=Nepenthes gracilis TaxID=150966 RepID=A0AAD3T754_NEPGR|nr:hypothetical protein Nepgr_026033 [Nepenthes gracilis]
MQGYFWAKAVLCNYAGFQCPKCIRKLPGSLMAEPVLVRELRRSGFLCPRCIGMIPRSLLAEFPKETDGLLPDAAAEAKVLCCPGVLHAGDGY